jgi:hypothetical protein
MKTFKIILIVAIGTFFGSCESNSFQELTPVLTVTNPTYTKDIAPILTSNCISCHSGSQSPNLTSYAVVKAKTDTGSLICSIDDPTSCGVNIMPPTSNGGRMAQAKIDLIKLWKTQGFIQ